MPTLKQMKKKLKEAAEMDKITISKGEKNQILIDLDGDGKPEAALIDTTDSDGADLLALDLTGDHKFNLYLDDTPLPKTENYDLGKPVLSGAHTDVYVDKNGDGNLQLAGEGECLKNDIHARLVKIYNTLVDEESDIKHINKALHELADLIKGIRSGN